MSCGNYYDAEVGILVPNSLKILRERHDKFLETCEQANGNLTLTSGKKWWATSKLKSSADSLINHLDHIILSMDSNESLFARHVAMKACVLCECGLIVKKMHIHLAEQLLKKSHELLWPIVLKPESYWLYFHVVFSLGEVLQEKDCPLQAIQLLEDAIKIYETNAKPKVIFLMKDIFSLYNKIQPTKERSKIFENLITKTFQFLINLYIDQCDLINYIKAEHFLLRRELNTYSIVPLDWIERCIIIGKILVRQHDFRNASHHLTIAAIQLDKIKVKTSLKNVEKVRIEQVEEALSLAWIKYGLMLLLDSKNAILVQQNHGDPVAQITEKTLDDITFEQKSESQMIDKMLKTVKSQHVFNSSNTQQKKPIGENVSSPSEEIERISSTNMSQALLTYTGETSAKCLSDAVNKPLYVDLEFPNQAKDEEELNVPTTMLQSPIEADTLYQFLTPWIETLKDIVYESTETLAHVTSSLYLNELMKAYAFFQPDIKVQYELHRDRQTELEHLAMLLRNENNSSYITTELYTYKELTIVHYQLTQMNLKRLKQLEDGEADSSKTDDIFKELEGLKP